MNVTRQFSHALAVIQREGPVWLVVSTLIWPRDGMKCYHGLFMSSVISHRVGFPPVRWRRLLEHLANREFSVIIGQFVNHSICRLFRSPYLFKLRWIRFVCKLKRLFRQSNQYFTLSTTPSIIMVHGLGSNQGIRICRPTTGGHY